MSELQSLAPDLPVDVGPPPETDEASAAESGRRLRLEPGVVLAFAWLAVVVLAAALANVLPLPDPQAINPHVPRSGPTLAHPFGTDDLGRDMLSRAVFGSRISLLVGALVTLVAGVVGGSLGLVAGYFRGTVENTIMGAADILLAFPALILALSLTAFLGGSFQNVVLAISIVAIPAFARVTRSQALSLRTREFVRAAAALGASTKRILFLEVAPNILPAVIAYGLLIFAVAIVVEGVLSFLGLGIPPPTPTWGGMIAAGQGEIATSPHLSLIPAAVMFVTVLALNVVAEWVSRRFDAHGGGR